MRVSLCGDWTITTARDVGNKAQAAAAAILQSREGPANLPEHAAVLRSIMPALKDLNEACRYLAWHTILFLPTRRMAETSTGLRSARRDPEEVGRRRPWWRACPGNNDLGAGSSSPQARFRGKTYRLTGTDPIAVRE